MKKILFILAALMMLAACHEGEDPDYYKKKEQPREPFDRTVLVYVAGENNLSSFIASELVEMRQGSKDLGNNALVVYVDDANSRHRPYIMRIHDGICQDSTVMESDRLTSDPAVLGEVLNYTSSHYPAREYGLVLWGHSSGWVLEDSVSTQPAASRVARRGYGVDSGDNSFSVVGKWLNMFTLNKVICEWGHLKFIFADCCQFQCVESAYELRQAADYIIASPAEVPGKGAPYATVVKGLFDPTERFYESIVNSYFEQTDLIPYELNSRSLFTYEYRTPFSVIKTSELPQLATATNTLLHTFLPLEGGASWPDLSQERLIYYRGNINSQKSSLMYDMNDLLLHYAPADAYAVWKTSFDRAVIYKVNAANGWMTARQILPYVFGKNSFGQDAEVILTDARYSGVSMFMPQSRPGTNYEAYTLNDVHYEGYNASIKRTSWYHAAQLSDFGW